METIRLDKFLSNRGIASRRGIKKFLKGNEVLVNGERITESGVRIQEKDDILINGEKVAKESLKYFILNKPVGIISTVSDEHGRENVVSLIDTDVRVYPVGRLDKDTSGLILLTNDGGLTHRLTHPKFHVPKKYLLTVKDVISGDKMSAFRRGVMLSDGITNPSEIEELARGKKSVYKVTLHEGRYRQIRRMCEALEIELLDLERIEFGPVKLGKLKRGEYRTLTKKEIEMLKKAAKI